MQQFVTTSRHFGSFVLFPVSTPLEPGRMTITRRRTPLIHKQPEVMVTASTTMCAWRPPCIWFRLSCQDGTEVVLRASNEAMTSLQTLENYSICNVDLPPQCVHEALDMTDLGVTCDRQIRLTDYTSWTLSHNIWPMKTPWTCIAFWRLA